MTSESDSRVVNCGLKSEQSVEHVCSVSEGDSQKVRGLTRIRHFLLFIHVCADLGEGMRKIQLCVSVWLMSFDRMPLFCVS